MTEFETMVREMREAQKAWFRYHDQLDLQKAKALEKKVDAALERKAALDQVPDLFADSNGEYGGRGNRSGTAARRSGALISIWIRSRSTRSRSKTGQAERGKQPPRSGVVFVGNMTDIFGEWNDPIQIVEWLYKLDDRAENLILTKRPERMAKLIAGINPMRRAWWGTTAENEKRYAERLLNLWKIRTPQVKTWISFEPLIGPIDLTTGHYIPFPFDWVVVGAESGPNRRLCDLQWVRNIVWQCGKAGVPVFVKQLDIGGKLETDIRKFPEDLQIRQVPWKTK